MIKWSNITQRWLKFIWIRPTGLLIFIADTVQITHTHTLWATSSLDRVCFLSAGCQSVELNIGSLGRLLIIITAWLSKTLSPYCTRIRTKYANLCKSCVCSETQYVAFISFYITTFLLIYLFVFFVRFKVKHINGSHYCLIAALVNTN